jgi:hypothetical protein
MNRMYVLTAWLVRGKSSRAGRRINLRIVSKFVIARNFCPQSTTLNCV